MLYAKKNQQRINAGLLIRLIDLLQESEGKQDIRLLFQRLFSDIHGIITKEKSYYTLDSRDNIHLISFMVKHHGDYFESKDIKSLVDNDLEEFKGYLEEATEKL